MTSKRKMSSSDKRVWQWLNYIGRPNKALNGNAICPWITTYLDHLMVVQSTQPKVVVDNFATFKDVFSLEAVVIHGFRMGYDKQYDTIDRWNKKYKKHDVFILGMRPDSEEPPLPAEYNFEKPLIICQKLSTLKKARQITAKTSDYYEHYNK